METWGYHRGYSERKCYGLVSKKGGGGVKGEGWRGEGGSKLLGPAPRVGWGTSEASLQLPQPGVTRNGC